MKRLNPEYVRLVRERLSNSPYPKHMHMRLTAMGFDVSEVVLDVSDCHFQPFGLVHGGVLATLIDTATFWAAYGRLPREDGMVNVDLKLNYLKPVSGGRLTATGRCLRAGRTISYSEATVTGPDGALVVHGTSTLMVLPGKGLDIPVEKFLDGLPETGEK